MARKKVKQGQVMGLGEKTFNTSGNSDYFYCPVSDLLRVDFFLQQAVLCGKRRRAFRN